MTKLLMALSYAPPTQGSAFERWRLEHGSPQRFLEIEPQTEMAFSEITDLDTLEPADETALDIRTYDQLWEATKDEYSAQASTHLMAVWMSVEDPVNFSAWYEQEHMPMLFKAPGWLRCRRFELRSGDGPRYLALHDLASVEAAADPAVALAKLTPWRNRVVGSSSGYTRRLYSRG